MLAHDKIIENSEAIASFVRDIDYNIDYENGWITVLSTGSMLDVTEYFIDYMRRNPNALFIKDFSFIDEE